MGATCLYSECPQEATVQGMWCEAHWPEVQASVIQEQPPPAPVDQVASQDEFDTEVLKNALVQSRQQIAIYKVQYALAKAGVPAEESKKGHPGEVLKQLRKAEKAHDVVVTGLTDGLSSPSPVLNAVADIEAPEVVSAGPPGGGDVA